MSKEIACCAKGMDDIVQRFSGSYSVHLADGTDAMSEMSVCLAQSKTNP